MILGTFHVMAAMVLRETVQGRSGLEGEGHVRNEGSQGKEQPEQGAPKRYPASVPTPHEPVALPSRP